MATTLNIPCSKKMQCDESPLANLSSETPDEQIFTSVYFPPINPPLNRTWVGTACQVSCTSPISQEDANLCAAARAAECDAQPPSEPPPPLPNICTTPGGCSFTPEPPYFPPTYPPPPPGTVPCNEPQEACMTCPDGSVFCYTVAACTFRGSTVAIANQIALSYARERVQENIVCLSGDTPDCCADVAYLSTVNASGGVTPFTWALASGSLPPGIGLVDGTNGRSVLITGTPTTGGNYAFTIRGTSADGNFIAKNFDMSVLQITAVSTPAGTTGVAYSVQFTASGGAAPYTFSLGSGELPPGLTLTSAGLLSGTPTTEGTYNFTISVSDSSYPPAPTGDPEVP